MKKLLIIFFIVLGIYFYRLNTSSQGDSLNAGSEMIKVLHINDLIINQNDTSTYNISINEPTELDFLSKQQVFDIRKQYAAMYPAFIHANYTPSDAVFGRIEDNKPWWGLIGVMFAGPGQHSIDGLSEESRVINNPLLLFMVDPNFWFVDLKLGGASIYPKPVSLSFQPSKKTINVVYDITNYNTEANNYLVKNANETFGGSNNYTLEGVNARDFGYNYAYAYSIQNIRFADSGNDLSTKVQQLLDFLHTGGSCGYPDGCNNASPTQKFLDFTEIALPAQLKISLWKQMPRDEYAPADLYYIINFQ